ncbi:MAG: tetratricopeptide repeat protein [Candidatus Obscuribacterales bacterium]|nr:tetratricopeptide repeat protein [Candidatus Obscuribacterales bacterium]
MSSKMTGKAKKNKSRILFPALALAGITGLSGLLSLLAIPEARCETKMISEELAPLLSKGYNLMDSGEYSSAVKTLSNAVKMDQDSITAKRYLAYALVRAGDPRDAITQLNQIVKRIKPTYFEWCTFGEAYMEVGGFDQAQSCFETALKQNPTSDFARSGLIRVNVKSKNYEAAQLMAKEGMKSAKKPELYDYYKDLYLVINSHQNRLPTPAIAKKRATKTVSPTTNRAQPQAASEAQGALRNMRTITNHAGG